MPENSENKPNTRPQTIKSLLEAETPIEPIKTISEYVSVAREISEVWQREDWHYREDNEDYLFNNTRIVGQVWFRGHLSCDLSLRPGLYREGLHTNLAKQPGSPSPEDVDVNEARLEELFNLEHDQRIDFTTYGHLLNEANHAKTAIDWYFLMQHHGIPTRLLDWTTNALAALFFSLDSCRQQREERARAKIPHAVGSETVCVWVIDAHWLATKLSDEWLAPLLAWSEDAERYVPSLEHLIDRMADTLTLLPKHAMPIEPPAMHPRVAAQEGRFIIFGRTLDLVDEKIRLEVSQHGKQETLRVRQIRVEVDDVDALLRDLAQLGVSRRTLFPDLAGLADFVRWKHFHKLRAYEKSSTG